jgi:predicted Zn finger-like uncharacterized protein
MIIECISCKKKFEVNSDLIPSTGRTIQCGSCDKVWFFDPNKENLNIKEELEPNISEPVLKKKTKEIKPKKKIGNLDKIEKKKFEVTRYKAKSSFNITKFLSYILVSIITFVALIILIDTFKSVLYVVFPGLELMIFSLFETLKDIQLFIKDLI